MKKSVENRGDGKKVRDRLYGDVFRKAKALQQQDQQEASVVHAKELGLAVLNSPLCQQASRIVESSDGEDPGTAVKEARTLAQSLVELTGARARDGK